MQSIPDLVISIHRKLRNIKDLFIYNLLVIKDYIILVSNITKDTFKAKISQFNIKELIMKKAILSILLFVFIACQNTKVESVTAEKKVTKRIGMVIGIKPKVIDEYKRLHADSNPGVRDLLSIANMENFSIFIHQFDDGKYYLFGYYEYTGEDFDADMAALAKKERNIEWLKVCDPMQIPFEGQNSWSVMEQVYYNK
jgi:L-rhamnose mutarotase